MQYSQNVMVSSSCHQKGCFCRHSICRVSCSPYWQSWLM